MGYNNLLEGFAELTLERVIPSNVAIVLAVRTEIIKVKSDTGVVGVGGHLNLPSLDLII
jgi:hypothetical protein